MRSLESWSLLPFGFTRLPNHLSSPHLHEQLLVFSSTSCPSAAPSIGATITGFTDVSTYGASGSQKCPFCRFMLRFLTAGSTCSADLGMMKPPESVNTATCPFSTKLCAESSGRRTFAASNPISRLPPSLVA